MENDERYQPSYDLIALKKSYEEVLSSITSTDFVVDEDLYSGVFLARPFDAYWQTHKKL